jgi:siroheme synthase (precorrin-2 oxidase/ferrochelatase)
MSILDHHPALGLTPVSVRPHIHVTIPSDNGSRQTAFTFLASLENANAVPVNVFDSPDSTLLTWHQGEASIAVTVNATGPVHVFIVRSKRFTIESNVPEHITELVNEYLARFSVPGIPHEDHLTPVNYNNTITSHIP